ncbi:MAG: 50S ribosomal protein L17 [Candidatus Moranbacteria bacterium]|jgi:large subunit ribosomal protein L17|nr:50S ribosomal protein L17 [Candidatus Moranbacteria bacterium]MDD5651820.1 50S ribosomal protein L17 [Candidatus Moranbacteria bacterium]MDX9855489.1 50S ribosomal protein L17 [Candidatus Moranbacteria bacterium]
MRHKKEGKKLSREPRQRRALASGLISNLILKERIITTQAKAKYIKPRVDKFITKIKKAGTDDQKKVAAIRDLRKSLNEESVKKISGDFINKFEGRSSGYTRIIKLPGRKSDGAEMAVIEFV